MARFRYKEQPVGEVYKAAGGIAESIGEVASQIPAGLDWAKQRKNWLEKKEPLFDELESEFADSPGTLKFIKEKRKKWTSQNDEPKAANLVLNLTKMRESQKLVRQKLIDDYGEEVAQTFRMPDIIPAITEGAHKEYDETLKKIVKGWTETQRGKAVQKVAAGEPGAKPRTEAEMMQQVAGTPGGGMFAQDPGVGRAVKAMAEPTKKAPSSTEQLSRLRYELSLGRVALDAVKIEAKNIERRATQSFEQAKRSVQKKEKEITQLEKSMADALQTEQEAIKNQIEEKEKELVDLRTDQSFFNLELKRTTKESDEMIRQAAERAITGKSKEGTTTKTTPTETKPAGKTDEQFQSYTY